MAKEALPKIRKFKIEDINEILEIEDQSFPKTPYSKEIFLNYANNSPDSFIIIETGKEIGGYIIFDLSGHVLSTAVKPSYRRKGFGKMLVMYALKSVSKKLWLEVRAKNTAAIEFYKNLGMKIIGKTPNYYESDDALIMVLSKSVKEG